MAKNRLSFKDIAKTLRGFSTPFGGISWQPPENVRKVVAGLIAFLEDKRVLFYPYHMEFEMWVIESILNIREELNSLLQQYPDEPELSESLKAMAAACRQLLDLMNSGPRSMHRYYEPDMWIALGQLRGVFGIHIARLCALFEIDVDEGLASIFPGPIED